MVEKMEGAECAKCQSCGAEIKADVCIGCMMDPKDCVCEKDVTSSVYPQ